MKLFSFPAIGSIFKTLFRTYKHLERFFFLLSHSYMLSQLIVVCKTIFSIDIAERQLWKCHLVVVTRAESALLHLMLFVRVGMNSSTTICQPSLMYDKLLNKNHWSEEKKSLESFSILNFKLRQPESSWAMAVHHRQSPDQFPYISWNAIKFSRLLNCLKLISLWTFQSDEESIGLPTKRLNTGSTGFN